MSEKEEFIKLPNIEDGECYCEDIEHGVRLRPRTPPITIGMWCVCELEPKHGKKRKFKVKMMGIRRKVGVYKL